MKHLVPFNELRKSTYRKVASNSGSSHRRRGENILQYAHEKGENEVVNKIWPDKFYMDNDKTYQDEYWSISDESNIRWISADSTLCFDISMISNWGRKKYLKVYFYVTGWTSRGSGLPPEQQKYTIDYRKLTWGSSEFRFTDRKEALSIWRFIKDFFDNPEEYQELYHGFKAEPYQYELNYKWERVKNFAVNKMWKSES
jgi:hypothetical protein